MKHFPWILKSKKSIGPDAQGAALNAKFKPRLRVYFDPLIVIGEFQWWPDLFDF